MLGCGVCLDFCLCWVIWLRGVGLWVEILFVLCVVFSFVLVGLWWFWDLFWLLFCCLGWVVWLGVGWLCC